MGRISNIIGQITCFGMNFFANYCYHKIIQSIDQSDYSDNIIGNTHTASKEWFDAFSHKDWSDF